MLRHAANRLLLGRAALLVGSGGSGAPFLRAASGSAGAGAGSEDAPGPPSSSAAPTPRPRGRPRKAAAAADGGGQAGTRCVSERRIPFFERGGGNAHTPGDRSLTPHAPSPLPQHSPAPPKQRKPVTHARAPAASSDTIGVIDDDSPLAGLPDVRHAARDGSPPDGAAASARTPLRCAFMVRTSRPSFVLQTLHVDHLKSPFLVVEALKPSGLVPWSQKSQAWE